MSVPDPAATDWVPLWSLAPAPSTPPVVAAANFPPANPVDGQECYLKLTTGDLWHLKYDAAAAGTSKWRFVGGPSLYDRNAAQAISQAANALADPVSGGVGPQVTLPAAGIYEVLVSFNYWYMGAGASYVGVAYPGSGGDQLAVRSAYPTGVYAPGTGRQFEITATGSGVCKIVYSGDGAQPGYYNDRTLSVRPRRIG